MSDVIDRPAPITITSHISLRMTAAHSPLASRPFCFLLYGKIFGSWESRALNDILGVENTRCWSQGVGTSEEAVWTSPRLLWTWGSLLEVLMLAEVQARVCFDILLQRLPDFQGSISEHKAQIPAAAAPVYKWTIALLHNSRHPGLDCVIVLKSAWRKRTSFIIQDVYHQRPPANCTRISNFRPCR